MDACTGRCGAAGPQLLRNHFPDTASRSRCTFRASFINSLGPRRSEGAGNAGRPMRPLAACAEVVVESTRVSQVTPENAGIPHAMVLRFPSRSPRRPAFLPPSSAKVASRELDASTGASGPHDFAVRLRRRRPRHPQRPPHPAPRFVTLRNAPLSGAGRRRR